MLGKAEAGLGKNCGRLEEGLENCSFFLVKLGANCNAELHKYRGEQQALQERPRASDASRSKDTSTASLLRKTTNVTSGWRKSCA